MKKIIATLIILTVLIVITFTSAIGEEVLFVSGTIEGYIKEIDNNSIIIETYDGPIYKLDILKDAVLKVDNTLARLVDFKPGMEIYGEIHRKRIKYLESYSTAKLGYIEPGTKVRTGIITNIDRNQITIRNSIGKNQTYYTSPITIVLKNGANVPLSTLYVGDRIMLYFDELNSNMATKIKIEGDSIKITNLYKGRLSIVDELEDILVLNDLKVYKNGKWREDKDIAKISYSQESPIYMSGYKVPKQNLKYYRGKEVYAATKNFFGEDKITKMNIKNRYQTTYSDKIDSINWYGEIFELENNKNIKFDDGTIIVKSNRLVDKYSLNTSSDVFISGDGRGNDIRADVLYVYNEDINNSNIGQNYLYAGKLDEITKNKVILEDFFLLNKNEWESFDDDKELYIDDETYIYDLEDNRKITREELYTGEYSVDDGSDYVDDNHLRDWYGYIYTDGDRISSIIVKKKMDSLLRQNINIGDIQSVYDDSSVGMVMNLNNVKQWSRIHDKWKERTMELRQYLEEALIVKGNESITYNDLKPNDKVYVVRDGFYGKFILVK